MRPGLFDNRSADFHLAEYNALRAEVIQLLETLRSLERNVVIAVGVSWGFLIDKRRDTPKWAWFVPVLFAVLGIWRVRGILKFFGQFREYLASLEQSFKIPDGPVGWQHFSLRLGKEAYDEKMPSEDSKEAYREKTEHRTEAYGERLPSGHSISDGTVAFWTTLLLVTLAAAIYEAFIAC